MSIDLTVLKTLGGLALLIVAYHVLGSYESYLNKEKEFSWSLVWKGLTQGLFILLSIAAIYVAGQLVPVVEIAKVNGASLTLSSALSLLLTIAFASYGYKAIKMLVGIFKISVSSLSEKTDAEILQDGLELIDVHDAGDASSPVVITTDSTGGIG